MIKALPKGGKIAEIGVLRGEFSEVLLAEAQPTELVLVDLWQKQTGPYTVDYANDSDFDVCYAEVVRKFGDNPVVRIMKMLSVDAAAEFEDEYFDWLFLDANHLKVAVDADLRAWTRKVKAGGYFTGHDYAMCSPHIELKDTLDAFLAETGRELFCVTTAEWPSFAFVV